MSRVLARAMTAIAIFGSYVLTRREGVQDVLADHWVLLDDDRIAAVTPGPAAADTGARPSRPLRPAGAAEPAQSLLQRGRGAHPHRRRQRPQGQQEHRLHGAVAADPARHRYPVAGGADGHRAAGHPATAEGRRDHGDGAVPQRHPRDVRRGGGTWHPLLRRALSVLDIRRAGGRGRHCPLCRRRRSGGPRGVGRAVSALGRRGRWPHPPGDEPACHRYLRPRPAARLRGRVRGRWTCRSPRIWHRAQAEVATIRARHDGWTPAEYLDWLGLLAPDLLAAHCIASTDERSAR